MLFFFLHHGRPPAISTLSLHDALPICTPAWYWSEYWPWLRPDWRIGSTPSMPPFHLNPPASTASDRKSTRLNSSHLGISYAVFCLKKKMNRNYTQMRNFFPDSDGVRQT